MKSAKETNDEKWDLVIGPSSSFISINLRELFRYRDLILLMVRRDFVSVYKQTILGPIWLFIQPLLTALMFTLVFGRVVKVDTNGIPHILFYLSGLTLWIYFADCLSKTSTTFISNASVFGKVYFPRMVIPLSVVISNGIKLSVQLALFLVFWVANLSALHPHYSLMFLFPLLVLVTAGLGMGFGIFISSLTTKYRDLTFLVGFGLQLLMYATIIFPVSNLHGKQQVLALLNPVCPIIEAFKYIFLGEGFFNFNWLLYSCSFMVVLVVCSSILFNKVEKSFMDTV